jgi:hypothetical protein
MLEIAATVLRVEPTPFVVTMVVVVKMSVQLSACTNGVVSAKTEASVAVELLEAIVVGAVTDNMLPSEAIAIHLRAGSRSSARGGDISSRGAEP